MASSNGIESFPSRGERIRSGLHWVFCHCGILWGVSNHRCSHGQGKEALQVHTSLSMCCIYYLLRLAVASLHPGDENNHDFSK